MLDDEEEDSVAADCVDVASTVPRAGWVDDSSRLIVIILFKLSSTRWGNEWIGLNISQLGFFFFFAFHTSSDNRDSSLSL